jgi:SgrR family transcriptional regulator
MSSQRLRVQFETLFKHFNGMDGETQIEEITDILSCTRRNARMVLNKLEEQGWIEWKPSSGRGKSSQLLFLQSRCDVINDLARRAIESGNLDAAFDLVDQDNAKLNNIIEQFFGLHREQSRRVLRWPYYRSLPALTSVPSQEPIAQYMIRNVFNGLVRIDDQHCVQPDLAYRWQTMSPRHWRFFLRSGVRFHDGSPLLTSDVVDALLELKRNCLLFSHIETVAANADQTIDIVLAYPDVHFDRSLTDVRAVIRRFDPALADANAPCCIGTGPYKFMHMSASKWVLEAFDDYFGYRSLEDRIEIHVMPQIHRFIDYAVLERPFTPEHDCCKSSSALESGCQLLLLNQHSGVAKDSQWAWYLSAKLNSLSLFRRCADSTIRAFGLLPAYGLRPGWVPHGTMAGKPFPPQPNITLSLVYDFDNPLFREIVEAIRQALSDDDIELNVVDVSLNSDCVADMWLDDIRIASDKPDAYARWFLCHSQIKAFATSTHYERCWSWVEQWRSDPQAQFNIDGLSQTLIEQHQVIPLFHRWMREIPFNLELK